MLDVTIPRVEDNPDDAALTELALRGDIPARLQVACDQALDYPFDDDAPRLVLEARFLVHPHARAHRPASADR